MKVLEQVDIGDKYLKEDESKLLARITIQKEALGDKLLLLSHHYQQDSVFDFADLVGDSLKLAKNAAQAKNRPYIVFCGVHFMAESADILTDDKQTVIIPDLSAGCSMADMASREDVDLAWEELNEVTDGRIIPITYVNSSALLKAFVGENGGSVCTSSNAERVLAWALAKGEKVLFFPDEHLGRNSAQALGLPECEVVRWDNGEKLGGNTPEEIKKAKVILWDGYCTVHMQFTGEQIANLRKNEPETKIIVHPECRQEVVMAADQYGSTEMIITAIAESPAGSSWAVGTEVNLVKRIARQFPKKRIFSLSPVECLCSTMYRINPAHLLWVLDNLVEGKVVNQITVPKKIANLAKIALNRMLEI